MRVELDEIFRLCSSGRGWGGGSDHNSGRGQRDTHTVTHASTHTNTHTNTHSVAQFAVLSFTHVLRTHTFHWIGWRYNPVDTALTSSNEAPSTLSFSPSLPLPLPPFPSLSLWRGFNPQLAPYWELPDGPVGARSSVWWTRKTFSRVGWTSCKNIPWALSRVQHFWVQKWDLVVTASSKLTQMPIFCRKKMSVGQNYRFFDAKNPLLGGENGELKFASRTTLTIIFIPCCERYWSCKHTYVNTCWHRNTNLYLSKLLFLKISPSF